MAAPAPAPDAQSPPRRRSVFQRLRRALRGEPTEASVRPRPPSERRPPLHDAFHRPVPPGEIVRAVIVNTGVRSGIGIRSRVHYALYLEPPVTGGRTAREETGWSFYDELRADADARERQRELRETLDAFYALLLCCEALRRPLPGQTRRVLLDFLWETQPMGEEAFQAAVEASRALTELDADWMPLMRSVEAMSELTMESVESPLAGPARLVGLVQHPGMHLHKWSKKARVVLPVPGAAAEEPPVLLCEVSMGSTKVRWQRGFTTDEISLVLGESGEVRTFRASVPSFNDSVGAYTLNFNGRAKLASEDNFRYVNPELEASTTRLDDFRRSVLQCGLADKHRFNVDVGYPCSLAQAFGIALAVGLGDDTG